jgi:hypothetical protein
MVDSGIVAQVLEPVVPYKSSGGKAMKNRLLIATVLLTLIVFAANGDCRLSTVRVELHGHGDYEVVLDGQSAGVRFGRVLFDRVRPGYHELSVIRISGNNHYGHHNGCRRNSCRPYPVTLATTSFRVRPGSSLIATVDRYGRVVMMDELPYSSCDVNGYGFSADMYPVIGSECDAGLHGMTPAPSFDPLLSDLELTDILSAASSRPFSSTRMEIVKTAIEGRMLEVEQVRSLMGLFTFESDRLAIAKMTYRNTIDRDRYYRLYDAFTFDSSIEELERYMRMCA